MLRVEYLLRLSLMLLYHTLQYHLMMFLLGRRAMKWGIFNNCYAPFHLSYSITVICTHYLVGRMYCLFPHFYLQYTSEANKCQLSFVSEFLNLCYSFIFTFYNICLIMQLIGKGSISKSFCSIDS